MVSEDEMATMQKLSNDYVPEVTGPLVSDRKSTHLIAAEYARADPVFVLKTTNLPSKYCAYRSIQGDGNCGWRALAFGYFESLLRAGDPVHVAMEEARLKTFGQLMKRMNPGWQDETLQDFIDETFDMLKRVNDLIARQDDGTALLAAFNEGHGEHSNAIIVHFRFITNAYIKCHAAVYEDFLPGYATVDEYCSKVIDVFGQEIDNIGLQVLIDAVIKPAGFSVEVLYLDLSPGEESNTLTWEADKAEGNLGIQNPTIRLLYRPGHFDILYKVEDTMNVAAISIPEHLVNPQIHRASGSGYIPCSGNPQYFERYDPDVLHLPGISYIPTAPPKTIAPEYYPSCSQTQGPVPCSLGSVTSSPYIPSALLFHSSFPDCASEDSFRPSKFQLDIDRLKYYSPQWEEIMEPCQTEAMKQAGESPAHYKNQRFQPQMWSPESENRSGRDSRGSDTPSRRSC